MSGEDWFPGFPKEIPASTETPNLVYLQVPGHYAVHRSIPDEGKTAPRGAEMVAELDAGPVAVVQSSPDRPDAGGPVTPVYALGSGGTPSVPTGLVFVRLDDGVRAEDRRTEFEAAGYRIARSVPYAPNACWLRAATIRDALSRIDRLSTIAGVRNVEPQMLSPRAPKF